MVLSLSSIGPALGRRSSRAGRGRGRSWRPPMASSL